jgi:hypothetical protein
MTIWTLDVHFVHPSIHPSVYFHRLDDLVHPLLHRGRSFTRRWVFTASVRGKTPSGWTLKKKIRPRGREVCAHCVRVASA